ncbi:MAG: outer membrane protein assembly factor BamE [Moraxellaceae bacterium]|nr:outer membrane protein assembly factor BamE [Moraxellaceae bacterium]
MIGLTSGCSWLRVYTIDVPQGTPISQEQVKKIQLGMNKSQVIYLIGTPAFRDTLEPNRWDYIYTYEAGTFGKRKGKINILGQQQYLHVYFSNGKVSRIEGIDSLPERRE